MDYNYQITKSEHWFHQAAEACEDATKARKGIDLFPGAETIRKAKPARNVIKVRPRKNPKDMG